MRSMRAIRPRTAVGAAGMEARRCTAQPPRWVGLSPFGGLEELSMPSAAPCSDRRTPTAAAKSLLIPFRTYGKLVSNSSKCMLDMPRLMRRNCGMPVRAGALPQ